MRKCILAPSPVTNMTDQKGQKMAEASVQGQNVERACCIAKNYLLGLCWAFLLQAAFATVATVSKGLALCTTA